MDEITPDTRKFLKNILFIDIETVSATRDFEELPERLQTQWNKKARFLGQRTGTEATPAELYFNNAGIYAEFGRIVCIALGFMLWNEKDELSLRVSSLQNSSERNILSEFKRIVEKYPQEQLVLCAHNGKEFDFPYICRRMLVNGISLPKALRISGKKPWQIVHLDTLELWKFGDNKNFTSLDLLAAIFDIPTSKGEISGDQVNNVYYNENDLEKIVRYCREDVVVLAQLFLKLNMWPAIDPERIDRVVK